ncbi:hypothetical protein QEH53_08685 [Pelagicoccus sp. SDUM812002]|nr:hypothetical protein [Pelagicoccus sp. SDUM812002]
MHWFEPELATISERINKLHPRTTNEILGYDAERISVICKQYSDIVPDRWIRHYIETHLENTPLRSHPDIDSAQNANTQPITNSRKHFPAWDVTRACATI